MTRVKAIKSLVLLTIGLAILFVKVNPWAALGVFVFIWGNNVARSAAK